MDDRQQRVKDETPTAKAECGAVAGIAPPRRNPPNRDGEHKSVSDKELQPARQLATDSTVEADPIADEAVRMLASPDLPRQIIDDVHSLGVVGEDDLILMVYVTATARLMPRAIHLCVHGGYSTGKSIAVGKVLDLFPPGDVNRATQLTSKHLLNLKDDEADKYRHKVIFIGEQTREELGLAFREMAESGEVSNLTVREGKSQVSVANGPVTFIATTTLNPREIRDEDASRMFYFATDESEEQTKRVMDARVDRAKNSARKVDKAAIIKKHQAVQARLAEYANVGVIVPYADLIKLPPHDPHSRRLHDRILLLLEAVTFLGQFRSGRRQEESDGVARVYADAEDWKIALPLIEVIVAQKYGHPDRVARDFMDKIKALGPGPFPIDDLVKKIGLSETTVRRRFKDLPEGSRKVTLVGKKHLFTFSFADNPLRATGLPTYDDVRACLRDRGKLENGAK